MLFVLTGDVQIGKTRWLESVVRELEERGVMPCGVIAPGVWVDRRDNPHASDFVDENGFEKLGIDNVLLPSGERIAFARRADLAERENSFDPNCQSAQANLRWHISDAAIDRVNSHFAELAQDSDHGAAPGFLVVDELGQLELRRGGGLTEAIALLEAGPSPVASHALIVVREALLPLIEEKFEAWGEKRFIKPDDASRKTIVATMLY